MGDAAEDQDDAPLTAEERAELRQFLRLMRLVRRGGTQVDAPKPPKVVRDREPPPEAYDDVINMRKRRGGDGA